MGKFLNESPPIQQVFEKIFITLADLNYISDKKQKILIPKGFRTDGYSKPNFTHVVVGHNFADDIRACILHDYLCKLHGYYEGNRLIKLSFKEVNDLFYEAMLSVGIRKTKAKLMYISVFFNFGYFLKKK